MNVATPATAFTVVVPPSAAPDALLPNAIVTAPVNPLAVSPVAVCATTVSGVSAWPATVFAGVVVIASFVAVTARAVAVNVSGDPASDPDVAVTVCAPTVLPSFHVVCASPLLSETALAVATEPPPLATANVTVTPPTPSPSLAVTSATSGFGSVLPARALWPEPDCSAIVVARGRTFSVT